MPSFFFFEESKKKVNLFFKIRREKINQFYSQGEEEGNIITCNLHIIIICGLNCLCMHHGQTKQNLCKCSLLFLVTATFFLIPNEKHVLNIKEHYKKGCRLIRGSDLVCKSGQEIQQPILTHVKSLSQVQKEHV